MFYDTRIGRPCFAYGFHSKVYFWVPRNNSEMRMDAMVSSMGKVVERRLRILKNECRVLDADGAIG